MLFENKTYKSTHLFQNISFNVEQLLTNTDNSSSKSSPITLIVDYKLDHVNLSGKEIPDCVLRIYVLVFAIDSSILPTRVCKIKKTFRLDFYTELW